MAAHTVCRRLLASKFYANFDRVVVVFYLWIECVAGSHEQDPYQWWAGRHTRRAPHATQCPFRHDSHLDKNFHSNLALSVSLASAQGCSEHGDPSPANSSITTGVSIIMIIDYPTCMPRTVTAACFSEIESTLPCMAVYCSVSGVLLSPARAGLREVEGGLAVTVHGPR